MNVAIIYGGKSSEHEISLISAAAVTRHINPEHNITLIAIAKSGKWFVQSDKELKRILNDENAPFIIEEDDSKQVMAVPQGGKDKTFFVQDKYIACDIIFPVLHGTYGEDGNIQGLFEMLDVPYVGCSTLASAITMDKEKTKSLLAQAGIPVVPGLCMRRSDIADWQKYDELLETAQKDLGFPMFVKPCSAGSSVGANLAVDLQHLNGAIMEAFNWDNKILIEKAINAREVECSVTGNPTTYDGSNDFEKLTAYGPGEIAPKHEFYDYDAKYNDPDGANLLIPADLSEEKLEQIRLLAKKAFKALDLCGLSRVDFFIDKNDNKIYLNEINTLPGFTPISMFPKMCEKFGLDFNSLTEFLINEGIARFKSTRNLQTSKN